MQSQDKTDLTRAAWFCKGYEGLVLRTRTSGGWSLRQFSHNAHFTLIQYVEYSKSLNIMPLIRQRPHRLEPRKLFEWERNSVNHH